MRPIEELADEAVSELRTATQLHDETRTPHLRRTAELFLQLRERHDDPKGRGPDYTGRSKEYRQAIIEIYEQAFEGVPEELRTRITSQVRYHVSTGVRERLAETPGALEIYGFNPKSLKERATDRVRYRRALLDMGLIDEATDDSGHVARLVHGARRLLQLASEEGLAHSDRETREFVRRGVDQITEAVPALMRDTDKVKAAEKLLADVDEDVIAAQPDPVLDEVDESLTHMIEDATKLRRQTTTAENTVATIDDLLSRYAPPEAHRQAQ